MVKRIFFPFFAAMVLLTLFTFWITVKGVTKQVEAEYWSRMKRVVRLLAHRPYLQSPVVQKQIEELLGSHIGFYDQDGQPLNPDLDGNYDVSAVQWPPLPEEIILSLGRSSEPVLFSPTLSSKINRILLSPLEISPHGAAAVGLMIPAEPLHQLSQRIFLALAANAGVGLVLLFLLVLWFSRVVSRHRSSLVSHMEKVAEGKLHAQVPETGLPEWQRLAAAFNRMLEQLQRYQNRLRASERLAAVGELSAVLAHEVRNPLTALKMMGQLLKRRFGDDPESMDLVNPMLREIDRIEELVQDISDWSRPRNPLFKVTDLNVLISDFLSIADGSVQKMNIKIVWKPGIIVPVAVDQAQIKQVLWNLLKNSEKVSKPGDTLYLQTCMSRKDEVLFSLRDQGPGLDEETAERVFEPFFSTSSQGLGLGLSISRRIVEDHGGRLVLSACSEGGAEANMVLPAVQAPSSPEERQERDG